MRRGTKAAEFLGKRLAKVREEKQLTMRAVAQKMNVPTATVSQIEKGQRALKENRIKDYANALEINELNLRTLWKMYDKKYPAPPIKRYRYRTKDETLDHLIKSLTADEKNRTLGYVECLIENRTFKDKEQHE